MLIEEVIAMRDTPICRPFIYFHLHFNGMVDIRNISSKKLLQIHFQPMAGPSRLEEKYIFHNKRSSQIRKVV